jgi:hypothetical protein
MATRRAVLLALALWVPGAAAEDPGTAAPVAACADPMLRLRATHAVDVAHACEASRRVTAFLGEARGMRLAAPVELEFAEVVELAFGGERVRVLGLADRAARWIRVTSMTAAWLRDPGRLMFGQPIDAELHTSLLVHEIAHVVIRDAAQGVDPGGAPSEYLAYVTQFATMAPDTRARILAAYPPGDFASTDEINDISHMMAPHAFGVRAWRHFRRAGGEAIIADILAGRLRSEMPPM